MERFLSFLCLVLKYGSFLGVLIGFLLLLEPIIEKEEGNTFLFTFLNGIVWTTCGMLMFFAMTILNWELYMFTWILFCTALAYLALFDCPPPKSNLCRKILSVDKALRMNTACWGGKKNG